MKNILSLLVLVLILAACTAPTTTITIAPITVTEKPPASTPTISISHPYPEPVIKTAVPNLSSYPGPAATPTQNLSAYPGPGTPGARTAIIPRSGYEPQPGDDKLERSQVFLDLANSQLVITGTGPVEVSVILKGDMPDPCHQLRVVVTPPNENDAINLEVYTLVDKGTACIAVLKPFEVTIPLGSYSGGQIQVYVNNELLGEFGMGYEPQPGDDQLSRGDVSVDLNNSKLLTSDTQPVRLSAILKGTVPDPCHQLRVVVNGPDENNSINLEIYSLVDSSNACITVIKPFEAFVPVGSFSSGHFIVYVNGQILGDFEG